MTRVVRLPAGRPQLAVAGSGVVGIRPAPDHAVVLGAVADAVFATLGA